MTDLLAAVDPVAKGIVSVAAAAAVLWGVHRKVWPRYSRWRARMGVVVDTLVGADPITDPVTGAELKPATPGIGHRMASLEEAVALMVTNDHRITALEHRVSALESDSV